jgi:hypothetical protein
LDPSTAIEDFCFESSAIAVPGCWTCNIVISTAMRLFNWAKDRIELLARCSLSRLGWHKRVAQVVKYPGRWLSRRYYRRAERSVRPFAARRLVSTLYT